MGLVSNRSLETRRRQQSVGGFLKTASLRRTLMLAKERRATVYQVSKPHGLGFVVCGCFFFLVYKIKLLYTIE